jgi:hypothetical protein
MVCLVPRQVKRMVATSCSIYTPKPLVAVAGPPNTLTASFTVTNALPDSSLPDSIWMAWTDMLSLNFSHMQMPTRVPPGTAAIAGLGGTRAYSAVLPSAYSTGGVKAVGVAVVDTTALAGTPCGQVTVSWLVGCCTRSAHAST